MCTMCILQEPENYFWQSSAKCVKGWAKVSPFGIARIELKGRKEKEKVKRPKGQPARLQAGLLMHYDDDDDH